MNHITMLHIPRQIVELSDDADDNYDDDDDDEDVTRPVLLIHWNWKIQNQRILETCDRLPVNFPRYRLNSNLRVRFGYARFEKVWVG